MMRSIVSVRVLIDWGLFLFCDIKLAERNQWSGARASKLIGVRLGTCRACTSIAQKSRRFCKSIPGPFKPLAARLGGRLAAPHFSEQFGCGLHGHAKNCLPQFLHTLRFAGSFSAIATNIVFLVQDASRWACCAPVPPYWTHPGPILQRNFKTHAVFHVGI